MSNGCRDLTVGAGERHVLDGAGAPQTLLSYVRCTTTRPDPTVFTHTISASSFDVFVEQD